MRKLLFIICILIGEGLALPIPAMRGLMLTKQPDGSQLSIYKRGDERSHNVFTKDGYLLLRDERKGWCYADVDASGKLAVSDVAASDPGSRGNLELDFLQTLRTNAVANAMKSREVRTKAPVTRGPGLFHYAFPVKGKQKGLVILVEFPDMKFNSKNSSKYNNVDSKTYFTEMLNKQGFDTYGGTGSARDWFIDNSAGQFDPEFDVFGPITLPQNMKYYGGNDYWGEDKNPGTMVMDACLALDEEINFKDYDRDGDGYVDNVYIFYAGYGEADSDDPNTIWPHSWTLSDATGNGSVSGNPLFLDGVYIDSYACSNETIGYNDYGILANRPTGIGTFVHEFSHVMGLPDLYSTNYENTNPNLEPFTPGEFSVMDYGPYNNGGLTPPNYSAYERYAFDWVVPEEIVTGTCSLEHLGDSNKVFIVKTDREDEFYLFENRQLKSWDKYIPGHGMLVWHIDFNRTVFYDNVVNNTRNHQYVDLVEADDIQDYPTRFNNNYGYFEPVKSTQSGDPFPGTANVSEFGESTSPALKSWSGKNLGVELKDITEVDGIISFAATVTDPSGVVEIEAGNFNNALLGDLYTLEGIFVAAVEGSFPELAPGIYVLRRPDGSSIKIAR